MTAATRIKDYAGEIIDKIWHEGSCHCGAVKFRVLHESLEAHPTYHIPLRVCNCSVCFKKGYIHMYPERQEIEWLSGWDEMKVYKFGPATREHKFCGTCGTSVCVDTKGTWDCGDVVVINVSPVWPALGPSFEIFE